MSSTATNRYFLIDVLRGSAIGLMFIYHFCFDLNYFGHVRLDFNHQPFWLGFRALIVSLFLGVVGISLQLAHTRHWRARPFFQRLGLLVGAALLVSLSSYLIYPNSFIFFGILHFIAVASLLGLLFLKLYYLNLILGVLVISIGLTVSQPFFDQPALQWFGLVTHKPITEDYVPLLPWFGVVLIGMFLGRWAVTQQPIPAWLQWQNEHFVSRTLAFGGKHGLLIYLLHQPILLGLLYLITRLVNL